MTIKTRLVLMIALVAVMLVGVGATGLQALGRANEGMLAMYEHRMLPVSQLADFERRAILVRFDVAEALLRGTPEAMRAAVATIERRVAENSESWSKYAATVTDAAEKAQGEKFMVERKRYVEEALKPAMAALREGNAKELQRVLFEKVETLFPIYSQQLRELIKLQFKIAEEEYAAAQARYATLRNTLIATIAAGITLLVVAGFFLIRAITRPLAQALGVFGEIGRGNYRSEIDIASTNEMGRLLGELKATQARLDADVSETKRRADEATRLKVAMDNGTNCMMIADAEARIIYVNRALMDMMRTGEADIRKELPGFRADAMIGASMDQFHRSPAHQRGLITGLRAAHKAQIRIGGRTYALTAVPVVNEANERLGTMVEWCDRTGEVALEGEVAGIVQAAAEGDFSRRLVADGKHGFFLQLAEGINRIMDLTSQGVGDVGRLLNGLAKGDLTQRIETEYQGLFSEVRRDSNQTMEQLGAIVTQIREATDAINTASREIAQGNGDLSSRTEQQASSLEETASSMEELTSTVRQNAENARQANQLAVGASDVATRGGEVVREVVTTMNGISESSKKIADIIGVIDGIAFQTNILALNAAVEAARAGEQGRGFAVVATEVRNLAQRSAAAAKEIKSLIHDSVGRIDTGSKLVDEAGRTMEEIVTSVKRVTDIMGEISAASAEQSSGIEQVNATVTQMDEVTQQNAALVEEAAAAAESLEEQARALATAVSVFRTAPGQAPAHTAPMPAAAPGGEWDGKTERRGPNRAKNVARMTRGGAAAARAEPRPEAAAKAPAPRAKAVGADDDWEEF